MKTIYFVLAAVLLAINVFAVSTQDYSDVLLVTNSNSTHSLNISAYYKTQRNIVHEVIINTSVGEQISFSTFNSTIKTPIESYLTANNLTYTINYVVLTKGVPIRILADANCRDGSVDSSLTIMLSQYEDGAWCTSNDSSINYLDNPMYNGAGYANKTATDIYLVTRLDGYTDADVFRLIGSEPVANYTGTTLLNPQPSYGYTPCDYPSAYGWWNCLLNNTIGVLGPYGKNYTYTTSSFVMNKGNLTGYFSWGGNDGRAPTNSSTWNLSFNRASIGDTAVSYSARSFAPGTTYGQSLIADLIADNITFVKGYVYEPTLLAISDPSIAMNLYVTNHTAAESLYTASLVINWMDIYVGDPKQRILNPAAPGPQPCNYLLYEALQTPMTCTRTMCYYAGTFCQARQTYGRLLQTCTRNGCS